MKALRKIANITAKVTKCIVKKKVKLSRNRPLRPIGL
jgi:hypothetical protein